MVGILASAILAIVGYVVTRFKALPVIVAIGTAVVLGIFTLIYTALVAIIGRSVDYAKQFVQASTDSTVSVEFLTPYPVILLWIMIPVTFCLGLVVIINTSDN
ncbi:hypothetical protein RF11_12434 [Thelohanellus kitauei]|uniref:Uncharacterized protein n=1 Tax=Thelohanellus kitauei TaxID=669202 RepID=A0A0C2N633_THEKT|nr:hypothetical protein RF11_12434 [Thelohanellus kitauei]